MVLMKELFFDDKFLIPMFWIRSVWISMFSIKEARIKFVNND